MNISVYRNQSDPKVIRKNIGNPLHTYTGVKLKENTSILQPVLNLTGFSDYEKANYVYIEDFGRYYFIDDIVALNYDMVELHCSVDVLYTYQAGLCSTRFEWVRTATLNSGFFPDPEWPLQGNKANINTIIGMFPNDIGDNKNNYYLTVAGGT